MAERIFTQTFGVVGAIIEKDGKILLVKESGGSDGGKWSHTAGWLDVGENPIVAGKREVEEETGYEFTPENILGIYSIVRKDYLKKGKEIRHGLKIIFTGKISDVPIRDLENDISEIKWFMPEEIQNMDMETLRDLDIKIMVKDYFEGKRYPLDLITHTISE